MTRSSPPAGKRFGSKLRSQSARHRMRWQYIRSSGRAPISPSATKISTRGGPFLEE